MWDAQKKYIRSEKGKIKAREALHRYRKTYKAKVALRKLRYNLTEDQYQGLIKQQENKCAICGRIFEPAGRRGPHVDHDHNQNKVRGLLCVTCNTMLGWFERRRTIIEKYLVI